MATYKYIQFKNPKFPHTTLTPKQSRPIPRSTRVNPENQILPPPRSCRLLHFWQILIWGFWGQAQSTIVLSG
ncbi:unnamed protein product [Prunus brigantina]